MERRYLPEDDPRSPLEKARRRELAVFAKQNHIDEITPDMPATLMRKILRSRGITNIRPGSPALGYIGRFVVDPEGRSRSPTAATTVKASQKSNRAMVEPEPDTIEIDAEALLEAQWRAQAKAKPSFEKMTIHALRKEAKNRGLSFARTDKKADLLVKLRSVENGAHTA